MSELVEYRITLLDGVCTSPALNKVAGGVLYGSLKTALADGGVDVKGLLPELSGTEDGAFVYVPAGVKAEGVFVVENCITANAGCVAQESAVILMDSATATVMYEVRCGGACEPSENRRVKLGNGASLRVEDMIFGRCGTAGNESCGGKLRIESRTELGKGAEMDSVTVEIGCGEASLNYSTDLAGADSRITHAGLFVINGEERADFDVKVNHLVPGCRSDVLVKGVAGDNASGSFSGMVYVARDAQHTEAYQQNRNLLLSDTAQITTSPQLEIYADDVKCSHGATVGQMNDDAIYYMRQRGLSEAQARGLQMTGFVNDIVSRISNEERRQEIFENLEI
jgi:Fe-S cluster assembly protein SufD